MSKPVLNGIIPAVVTPIDAQERFAPAPFEALLAKMYSAGVHGIYVCGQTGEGLLQTVEQRKLVAEASMRFSPAGKQVIIHVGSYRTADAVELARHAAEIGVTAVSALPPFGSYSFDEIHAYYREIAAASDLPLLVYYFPEVCAAIKTEEQILQLCAIPNVVGLKFTDFDLYRLRHIRQSGSVIFNGRDEVLAAGLMMGADGGIGTFYNLVPELFVEIYNHALRGDFPAARAVQDRVNAIVRATLRFPVFPAIKEVLRWSGIDCGRCLRPRAALTAEQAADLRRAMSECGLA
jgi:Dihydrodipicolinate synthase/N-acetylneuraminate lyase